MSARRQRKRARRTIRPAVETSKIVEIPKPVFKKARKTKKKSGKKS
jgi:hypothetical protein